MNQTSNRTVRGVVGLLRWLWVALGAAQAAYFAQYALSAIPSPLETSPIEAKMVYFARLARQGGDLYPDWRVGPFESNFYAPLYFVTVGAASAEEGSSYESLFRTGRWISFVSAVVASAAVGMFLAGRLDRSSGVVGAIFAFSGAPLYGFAVMVRPDLAANALGGAGMLLCFCDGRAWIGLGALLLIAAGFTKQTALVYLLASAAYLGASGRWKSALWLVGGSAAAVVAVAWALNAWFWPNFVESALGESSTAFSADNWRIVVFQLLTRAPFVAASGVVGSWLWATARPRESGIAAAALVLTVVCFATVGKLGAYLNYFLPMTVVAGLAAGILWRRSREASIRCALVLVVCTALTGIGTLYAAQAAQQAERNAVFFQTPAGRANWEQYLRFFQLAADPQRKILTDCGLIALRQSGRAPFVDPWTYRMLALSGKLDQGLLADRVADGEFELVLLTAGVEEPNYDDYPFGLPPKVAAEVRRRYREIGVRAGLHLYIKKEDESAF